MLAGTSSIFHGYHSTIEILLHLLSGSIERKRAEEYDIRYRH
jgi:hypothetical protein